MEDKKCPDNNYKESNFENFIKLQKELLETFHMSANVAPAVLTYDELFQFFEHHFNEFRQSENINGALPFIHRCLKVWANQEGFLNNDIGIALTHFLEDHKDNENDLHVVVQIVYQVLNSIKSFENKEITISQKLIRQLISLLLTIKSRTLVSSIVTCIQLYMKMFPESCEILLSLWSDLSTRLQSNSSLAVTNDTEIDILIQLYDDLHSVKPNFHDDPILITTIQKLLKSDQKKYRKCGYYLFRKNLSYLLEIVHSISTMLISHVQSEQLVRPFLMYLTLLENLEEEQSHLILPSLANLNKLIKFEQLQSSWLNILYMRILTHNNNLVLRFALEFFLKTFSCSDLCADILKNLLEATNTNLLYNYEGYFLNMDNFSSFLNGNLFEIYTLIPEVNNWKSIPLYLWLEELNKKASPKSITYELILKISACVRKLQNRYIRQKTIYMCNDLFKDIIEKMSMEEYVTYVETLYNSADQYPPSQLKLFFQKSLLIRTTPTTQRFYEILRNNVTSLDIKDITRFLNTMPVQNHSWFKFRIFEFFKYHFDKDTHKLFKLYKMDMNYIATCRLHEVINYFKQYIQHSFKYDEQVLRECHRTALMFYINFCGFNKMDDESVRLIFNSEIDANVKKQLTYALNSTMKKLDFWIIDEFVTKIWDDDSSYFICDYILKHNMLSKYMPIILDKYSWNTPNAINILKDTNSAPYFNGCVSRGETRIEEAFCHNRFCEPKPIVVKLKHRWLDAIRYFGDDEYILYLLKYHKDLTKQKPRYFENSYEHRVKLRIAIGILEAFLWKKLRNTNEVFDQIWNILINENNQLNIVYIYEYILGSIEERAIVIEKLKMAHTLTSRQQVSIITVAYAFSKRTSLKAAEMNAIISNLLGLTMGANFQTRLFAQMALKMLLNDAKYEDIIGRDHIIESIQNATREQLQDHCNDIRLQMWSWNENIANNILHVTNAPFDELLISGSPLRTDLVKCRETFMKKFKETSNEAIMIESVLNNQIQRKMNPVNDLTTSNNLITYPIKEKSAEMVFIASLIDKLPNLGGIARTCEVLGIKNLVLDSKMHIEKTDFKNLSMTAENSLNIIEVKPKDLQEFLVNKKLQGFKIVGAEQTCNSVNFVNFKFPSKCVLLLGHEKDGIPAPLLGMLDYAVEIPQFGQVRSLNVHVTGALFAWEYCKQHLMEK